MKKVFKILLFVILLFQIFTTGVFADGDILSLYKGKPSDNIPFSVTNMFPGDYIKQDYIVRVSYNGTITVYFTADVRPEYEKLAEVLKCKVVIPDRNTILYDGLMRDTPDIANTISGVNITEDLKYEIAVYLDTSVGNEYQDLSLIADFKWWVTAEEIYGEGYRPDTDGGSYYPQPSFDRVTEETAKPVDDDDKPITGHENQPTEGDGQPTDSDEDITDVDEPIANADMTDSDKPVQAPDEQQTDQKKPTGELIAPPKTGDDVNPWIYITIICLSLLVIFLILFVKKKNKNENNDVIRKLTISIAIIIVLAVCLCITTFALIYSAVIVEDNVFQTGKVQINLNDGKPIITENEFLFEPGMTVKKEFFIKNESSDSVYYKIYLDAVKGGLAKVLDVKILDNKTGDLLYDGKANTFTQKNSKSDELILNEKRMLTAIFHYPEESGNSTQNMSLEFNMCATATQKRNNDGREFS